MIFISLITLMVSCNHPTNRDESNSPIKASSKAVNLEESSSNDLDAQNNVSVQSELAESMISSLREYMIDGSVQDITVKWYYPGNISHLWGDGLAINLQKMNCTGEPADTIRCFLEKYSSQFGVDSRLNDLVLEETMSLKNGITMYRFNQHVDGYTVLGSDIIAKLDRDGNLIQVYSHYVNGLNVRLGNSVSTAAAFEDADINAAKSLISNELNVRDVEVTEYMPAIYVDRKNESTQGIPVMLIDVAQNDIEPQRITFDFTEGRILQKTSLVARREVWMSTRYIHPYIQENATCTDTNQCLTGYICSDDYEPKRCVIECTQDSDCYGIWRNCWGPLNMDLEAYWQDAEVFCWDTGSHQGYCHSGAQGKYVVDGVHNGVLDWSIEEFEDHKKYRKAYDTAVNSYNFICNVVGHTGDFCESWFDIILRFESHCSSVLDSPYLWDCLYTISATPYLHVIDIADDFGLDFDSSYWKTYWDEGIAHEYGHIITYYQIGDTYYTGESCLTESIAQLYGILYAVSENGYSNISYGETTCHDDPWHDDINGLADTCRQALPYAHRSRFDWLPCESEQTPSSTCGEDYQCKYYEYCDENLCTDGATLHNNMLIWTRFARVLAEGSDTFDNDGNGEDVGIVFTGIDNAATGIPQNTIDIIHQAVMSSQLSTTLEDWVELLESAGSVYGHLTEVRYALGIAGFVTTTEENIIQSSSTPYAYDISSWPGVYDTMLIYQDYYMNNLKVAKYDSNKVYSKITIDTINANYDDESPTAVMYKNVLYVFWRDKDTNSIKYKTYYSNGNIGNEVNIGMKGIKSAGAFDATVYDGYLYLVYSYPGTNLVHLSKCSDLFACTYYDWHDFLPGRPIDYKRSLGYYAYPGLGVETAELNGHYNNNEYIYIVSSSKDASTNYDIRIDMVYLDYAGLEVVSLTKWMPDYYPSFETDGSVIGVKAVTSAFNQDKQYLYMAWEGESDSQIYMSVIQSFSVGGRPDTWITKSVDTFLSSDHGVRLKKGGGYDLSSVDIVTNDFGGVWGGADYHKIYGRY
jgi:hypothetical protein